MNTVSVPKTFNVYPPPTFRLEVEGGVGGGYTLNVLGTETVFIPYDASANEVSAAINQVLDNDLYGWTEVRERAAAYGNHPHVRAWDASRATGGGPTTSVSWTRVDRPSPGIQLSVRGARR